MANNTPRNDFAPPWLKIPCDTPPRSAGSKGSNSQDRVRQRRHEDSFYPQYGSDCPRSLSRQNSFDMYDASAAGRRNSPSHSNKYCQHSAEDDYYYNNYGYGYYAYLYGDQYPVHTGSQRSSQRMDLKYTPPSSRISQTNGSFSSKYYYYDFYPSANDGFNSYSNGGSGSGKRSHFSRDGIGEMRCGSKDSDRSSFDDDDDKDKNYINDSLLENGTGDDDEVRVVKSVKGDGVLDTPPRSKMELCDESKKSPSRALRGGGSKGTWSARVGMATNGCSLEKSPGRCSLSREAVDVCSPGRMEILGTRCSRQAYSRCLLSELSQMGSDSASAELNGTVGSKERQDLNGRPVKSDGWELDVANGVSDLCLDNDSDTDSPRILSTSMEKEFQFLRSLGWNPNDPETEITEDEKLEFLKLRQRNGRLQNGPTRILARQPCGDAGNLAEAQPTQRPVANSVCAASDTDSGDDADI